MFKLALKHKTPVYSLDVIRTLSDINQINYYILLISWLSLEDLFP